MAFNMKAIVAQKLLPTIREDVKRVPIIEIMTFNPTIWYLVADRLSQPVDGWKPFERRSWSSLLYPAAGQ